MAAVATPVAAPAVRNIADRIAGFLGVQRHGDRWRTVTGEKIPQAGAPPGGAQ